MELDESIDLVDSEAVTFMDRLLLKRNTKILASIPKKVKMLIHHVFIHTPFFFKVCHPC